MPSLFEEEYYNLRCDEKRILSDAEVRRLPLRKKGEHHYDEWLLRAKSARRVKQYLQEVKGEDHVVMDLGCGNGWFSNLLASGLRAIVIGMDINTKELKQARRVFHNDKVIFFYSDIFSDDFKGRSFDFIFLNAACQYFSKVKTLIARCLQLLKIGGEIHILDSPLYSRSEVKAAGKRSREYFKSIGHAEMAQFYFHHSKDALTVYEPEYLYLPDKNKINGKWVDIPFPWLRIVAK